MQTRLCIINHKEYYVVRKDRVTLSSPYLISKRPIRVKFFVWRLTSLIFHIEKAYPCEALLRRLTLAEREDLPSGLGGRLFLLLKDRTLDRVRVESPTTELTLYSEMPRTQKWKKEKLINSSLILLWYKIFKNLSNLGLSKITKIFQNFHMIT